MEWRERICADSDVLDFAGTIHLTDRQVAFYQSDKGLLGSLRTQNSEIYSKGGFRGGVCGRME